MKKLIIHTIQMSMLSALLAPALLAKPPQNVEQEKITAITIGVTPGKPMSIVKGGRSAEAIEVRQLDGKHVLTVMRNVRPFQQEKAELTKEEWLELSQEASKLIGWKPKELTLAVDYGTRIMKLETTAKTHSHSWNQPIENKADLKALRKKLLHLAKKKIPSIKLHYIHP